MNYKTQLEKWEQRRLKIVAMAKGKGAESYPQIARKFGISRQRVQQIVSAHGGTK